MEFCLHFVYTFCLLGRYFLILFFFKESQIRLQVGLMKGVVGTNRQMNWARSNMPDSLFQVRRNTLTPPRNGFRREAPKNFLSNALTQPGLGGLGSSVSGCVGGGRPPPGVLKRSLVGVPAWMHSKTPRSDPPGGCWAHGQKNIHSAKALLAQSAGNPETLILGHTLAHDQAGADPPTQGRGGGSSLHGVGPIQLGWHAWHA